MKNIRVSASFLAQELDACQTVLSPSLHLVAATMDKAMKGGGGGGSVTTALAEKTGLKPEEVNTGLGALQEVACAQVAKTGKFVIPQVVMLKLKHKAARPAGKRMMFGKEVKVAAKKASKVVKAFPAKSLKNAI